MPLAVSDLSLGFISALTAVLLVQFLKLCDLSAEIPNLFAKHCQVVHIIKTNICAKLSVSAPIAAAAR